MVFAEQRQELMQLEWPYPGQIWKHEDVRAIIIAVSLTRVSYEDLSKGRAATENLSDFLNTFRRMKR